jgi:hypothetical protein
VYGRAKRSIALQTELSPRTSQYENVKIDTDLGGVLHRQYRPTCPHIFCIEFCGEFEVDLRGVEKFSLHSPEEPRHHTIG